jgi:hypothetical protein
VSEDERVAWARVRVSENELTEPVPAPCNGKRWRGATHGRVGS